MEDITTLVEINKLNEDECVGDIVDNINANTMLTNALLAFLKGQNVLGLKFLPVDPDNSNGLFPSYFNTEKQVLMLWHDDEDRYIPAYGCNSLICESDPAAYNLDATLPEILCPEFTLDQLTGPTNYIVANLFQEFLGIAKGVIGLFYVYDNYARILPGQLEIVFGPETGPLTKIRYDFQGNEISRKSFTIVNNQFSNQIPSFTSFAYKIDEQSWVYLDPVDSHLYLVTNDIVVDRQRLSFQFSAEDEFKFAFQKKESILEFYVFGINDSIQKISYDLETKMMMETAIFQLPTIFQTDDFVISHISPDGFIYAITTSEDDKTHDIFQYDTNTNSLKSIVPVIPATPIDADSNYIRIASYSSEKFTVFDGGVTRYDFYLEDGIWKRKNILSDSEFGYRILTHILEIPDCEFSYTQNFRTFFSMIFATSKFLQSRIVPDA